MVEDVAVGCPECKTSRTKPLDEARQTINEHNENMHDGDPVAGIRVRVDGRVRYYPHPDDAGEDVRKEIIDHLRDR